MVRPKLEFLSQETVTRAIDEAYDLLWDPGVRVHYDEALRRLAAAGALVVANKLMGPKEVMTA